MPLTRKIKVSKNKIKGGNNVSSFLFTTNKISTQPNTDPSYKEIGVIHMTESTAASGLRSAATDIANFFGKKGFDNTMFDKARNQTLTNIETMLEPNMKVSNLRIETNITKDLYLINVYGTLLEKKIPQQNI